jgi:hypothetical protein
MREVFGRAHTTKARGGGAAEYMAPGAIVLASGAIAAMGYVFKNQIGGIILDALKTAAKRGTKAAMAVEEKRDEAMDAVEKLTDHLSVDSILRFAGLQRRSTIASIVGPAIGVGCGVIAGATLSYFFGPKILEQLKEVGAAAADAVKSTGIDETIQGSTMGAEGQYGSVNNVSSHS